MADRQADDLAVIFFKVQLLLSLAGLWSHPNNSRGPFGCDRPGQILLNSTFVYPPCLSLNPVHIRLLGSWFCVGDLHLSRLFLSEIVDKSKMLSSFPPWVSCVCSKAASFYPAGRLTIISSRASMRSWRPWSRLAGTMISRHSTHPLESRWSRIPLQEGGDHFFSGPFLVKFSILPAASH